MRLIYDHLRSLQMTGVAEYLLWFRKGAGAWKKDCILQPDPGI